MFKIFRYMKDQWYLVLLVVALLIVQAQCDLSLPDYTSKIIDTGIQYQGMKYGVPQLIREEEHEYISYFLTTEEASEWDKIYDKKGDIYELNIAGDEKLWEEADAKFQTAIIMNSNMKKMSEEAVQELLLNQMQNMDTSDFKVELNVIEFLDAYTYEVEEEDENGERVLNTYVDIRPVIPMLMDMSPQRYTDDSVLEMRNRMEEEMESVGDSMLHSMAVTYAIEEYQASGGDIHQLQRSYLLTVGGQMLGITVIMVIATILVSFFASRVGAKIGMNLRNQVFQKVVTFTNREMDQFSTASLITRSTNDIQQVQMVSTMLLRMMIYAPILGIGGVLHVLNTNSGMEWIIVMAVALILVLVLILMKVAMPKFKQMQKKIDNLNLVSREILTGIPVIRAFVREKTEEERFEEANKDLTKTMLFTNRVMTFMMPMMMLIMNGISVLIVWVASNQIDAGNLQVGVMTAFITYTMQIVMSFLMICMISIMLPRAGVAVDRIEEVLHTEVLVNDEPEAEVLKDCKGIVEFHHVNFRYPGAETDVLEDIDFMAKPGETTAIIGSTGCGKSTLIQLIPRFYDVTEGSITIDGKDIRSVTQESLREQIGLVPQKGILFSGTIASNLRFGKDDASIEELRESAEIAQAIDFIEEKTAGFESSIAQGGTNVSGGQKQRLSIARAIVKQPKIYIFDDSFSALDFKTDVALRKALEKRVKDSTVLIVAQRISTILHADQILVLDEGRIVGKGTHESLMESCEVYQQIAKSQLSDAELQKERGLKSHE